MISEFASEKIFWTQKMNLKLVKFIESRPYMWNSMHPKYTKVDLRDKTCAEFAAKYGNEFSGRAVKHRWTNIRSTFAHYLRKLKKTEKFGEKYQVNWHLWDACQFLLNSSKRLEVIGEEVSDQDVQSERECTKRINFNEPNSSTENEPSSDENELDNTETQLDCQKIADSVLNIFTSIQNDAFGLDNTSNGKVGRAVAKKLAHLSSFEAAAMVHKISEVLLLYDDGNPDNPSGSG